MSVPAADMLRRQLFSTMALIDAQNHDRISVAAADLLDEIAAMHRPVANAYYGHDCGQCSRTWPCPTARLLQGEADRG